MHFKVKSSLVINIGMSLGKHKLCNRSRVGHWHAHGLTSCALVDMHKDRIERVIAWAYNIAWARWLCVKLEYQSRFNFSSGNNFRVHFIVITFDIEITMHFT